MFDFLALVAAVIAGDIYKWAEKVHQYYPDTVVLDAYAKAMATHGLCIDDAGHGPYVSNGTKFEFNLQIIKEQEEAARLDYFDEVMAEEARHVRRLEEAKFQQNMDDLDHYYDATEQAAWDSFAARQDAKYDHEPF